VVERKIVQVDESAPLISKKKRQQGLITVLILIIVVAIIVLSIIWGTGDKIQKVGNYSVAKVISGSLVTSTEASGTVVFPTQVSIIAMEAGYADKLYVSVGDYVNTDTILAQMAVPDLEKNRVDLENNLETQQISLEQVLLSNEYSIKELNIEIKRKVKSVDEAKLDVEKAKELMSLKSSRESDYETALKNLENLQNQLEDLNLSLEKVLKQSELDVRAKETQIRQNQINLDRIIEDIENAKIKSPISGTVLTILDKLSVPGSKVAQNVEMFTIADTSDVYVDLEVYEQYRSTLNIGDKMDILISSNIIEAEIIQIGTVATQSSDSLSATIEVRAKPVKSVNLTLGASAVADIPLGTKENALLLPRGAYLTSGSQKYVYVINGQSAYKKEVVYGAIDGTQVEVLSGLKKGDQIIISSYQNFIDQDEIELSK